jgi:enoyl-CoA hydratase
MAEHLLLSEPSDGVVWLTLNRPERKNALSIALRDALTETLAQLASDEAVKVAVVTGAGDVFSAGFDLREFERLGEPDFAKRLWDSSDRYHRACLEFPLPLVAAVNGPAIAGGFDLAVMCDLRIAASTARFAHPEIAFGDVVYAPLHDLVGGALARELVLTGRAVGAEEGLRLGLVSRVVAPDALPAEVARFTGEIARAPRANLLRTKAKIQRRAGIRAGATLDL